MADTTVKLRADISQLKSQFQQASRAVKLANSEFKAMTAGMENWNQSATGLNAKLKQLDTTLGAQKTQLSLLEKELEATVKAYGENSASADRVRIAINNQKTAIANTEKQIEQYDAELQKANKYGDNFEDELNQMNDASNKTSDGFTVMKGALASLVADGIQLAIRGFQQLITDTIETGMTFEKSMSKVQALSGATSDEMKLLSDTAKEFGKSTEFSASEASDALGYMALAGWNAQESVDGLGGVLDLASASGMELATASDMVTDYLSAFGLEAKDSSRLADVLAYSQANANTTAEQLGEAFKNCASVFNAGGQDVETTASLLAVLANQGIKGAEAGTQLSAVMRDMTSKMKNGAIQIGDTAVQVQDANGNYRDMTDILIDVEKATEGMGSAEKATALMSTFTARSIKGLNTILNAGVGEASSFEEQLRNCKDTASETAKTMRDNLGGDIKALESKIEGVKIQVYESLTPALRDSVKELSGVVDSINWDKVGKELGQLAVKAVDFGKKIIENADGIISVIKTIGVGLATTFIVTKITAFASSIVQLYTIFKALKLATDSATASQLLLNMAQNATPIGIVATAIAGLTAGVAYLITKQDTAIESTKRLSAEEEKAVDAINDMSKAYKELKTTRNENVTAIENEYGYYQELSSELDDLVDANGQVKAGYEDRVNFILNTLNEACGTEMELIDGVIQNYADEKKAIEDLIATKKAEAILRANEESYTSAIQNQNEALKNLLDSEKVLADKREEVNKLQEKSNKLASMTVEEYAKLNNLEYDMGSASRQLANDQKEVAEQLKQAGFAVGEANTAYRTAEQTYTEYQSTIKNYEGLSSAIISKDQKKISEALSRQKYDFQTAETGTERSLKNQVKILEDNYESMKQAVEDGSPAVTQAMVDEAGEMLKQAKIEYNKVGKSAGKSYSEGIESEKQSANTAGSELANEAKRGVDSVDTTQSGIYFAEGFTNGISSKFKNVFDTAFKMAQQGLKGVKEGQKEGSPSKLTYQSGVFFTQGFINGILSEQENLFDTVKNMVSSVVMELAKLSNYNFDNVADIASNKFSSALDKKFSYTIDKMQYQNEEKLAEFDSKIEQITAESEAEQNRLQSELNTKIKNLEKDRDKTIKEIEKARDKHVNELQAKLNKLSNKKADKEKKKQLQAEITAEKNNANEQIKAIKSATTKKINAQKKSYQTLIDSTKAESDALIAQEKSNKEAYQKASSEMVSEYREAMSNYQSEAQKLIDDTINGITERYSERYDELMNKQSELISKMKSAESLFEVSGAGVMTIGDLQEQTRQIKEYASKLQDIKNKVSSELFDEIASFDMKEGSAYMNQLLSMNANELQAYNEAYIEKLRTAEEIGANIYKKDIEDVASDYQKEINTAFNGLPAQLEALGQQAMAGFMEGLVGDTDYMSQEIKTYINAMLDTFRSTLQIHSPSKVMEKIGDYTGVGFIDGFKGTIRQAKQAVNQMIDTMSQPLDMSSRVGIARRNINNGAGVVGSSQVVNNYNLVQNNTSPKSLTALETYQARRQQIALVKALT